MSKFGLMLPHINIILSLMMVTFYIINMYNTAMGFLDNPMTDKIIMGVVIVSLISSIRTVILQRKIYANVPPM